MEPPKVTAVNGDEVADAFKQLSKDMRKELIGEIKGVAERVVTDARSIALSKMEQHTGALVRGIRVGRASLKSVEVQSRAKHRGYPYPVVMEYGGRSGGGVGPRASLTPAAQRNEDRVRDAIGDAADKFANRRELL